jgi:hypothetical protein
MIRPGFRRLPPTQHLLPVRAWFAVPVKDSRVYLRGIPEERRGRWGEPLNSAWFDLPEGVPLYFVAFGRNTLLAKHHL